MRADNITQHEAPIAERLAQIEAGGVPNYFGEQRFGRNGANVELGRAIVAGRRMSRNKRSIGISALRSLKFNEGLDARVKDSTWNRILPGDTANLDGTRSIFTVDDVTAELEQRCSDMDIHPSGLLPGIDEIGVEASSRPLRVRVADLGWAIDDDALWLKFQLPKGAYATTVLREIVSAS